MKRCALLIALLSTLTACGSHRVPNAAWSAGEPGPLEVDFNARHEGWEYFEPFRLASTNTSEIAIEHTRCYGVCATYSAALFANGHVYYRGQANVARVGEHAGVVTAPVFDVLAQAVVDLGFFELRADRARGCLWCGKRTALALCATAARVLASQRLKPMPLRGCRWARARSVQRGERLIELARQSRLGPFGV